MIKLATINQDTLQVLLGYEEPSKWWINKILTNVLVLNIEEIPNKIFAYWTHQYARKWHLFSIGMQKWVNIRHY